MGLTPWLPVKGNNMGFFIGKILLALMLLGLAYISYVLLTRKEKAADPEESEANETDEWSEF